MRANTIHRWNQQAVPRLYLLQETEAGMNALDTATNGRDRRAAMRRLDDVWGPVGRRSGRMVAGCVLLLISLGVLLLDTAMNQPVASTPGTELTIRG